jgi:hypothetical protein
MSDPFETLTDEQLSQTHGGFSADLRWAMGRAKAYGLRITSTTGGRHARHSYHYRGRAFDAAGSARSMRAFYREMSRTHPTELFYDPMGGMKHGRQIGAIGGHRNHVHLAF